MPGQLQAQNTNEFIQGLLGQMDQQRQMKQQMLMQMVQSGQMQPAQQQQPTTFMQRFGNNVTGPNLGSPNPSMGGQQFQQVTPQMRQQQLQQQMQAYGGLLGQSGGQGQSQMEKEVSIDPSTGQAKLTLKAKPSDQGMGGLPNAGDKTPEQLKTELSKSNPAYSKLLEKYASGDLRLAGRGQKQQQKIMADLALLYPGVDQKQLDARYSLKQEFTKGKTSQNIKALDTATNHLNTLYGLVDKLGNGPWRTGNKIGQWGAREFGTNPNVNKFAVVKNALAGELATIFKNSSGTDKEIENISNSIQEADSPQSLKEELKSAIDIMAGRVSSIQDQWKKTYDLPTDKAYPVLSNRSQGIIKNIAGIDLSGEELSQVGEPQQEQPQNLKSLKEKYGLR